MRWFIAAFLLVFAGAAQASTPSQTTLILTQPDPDVATALNAVQQGCRYILDSNAADQFSYTIQELKQASVWPTINNFYDWNSDTQCSALIDRKHPQAPSTKSYFTASITLSHGISSLNVSAVQSGTISVGSIVFPVSAPTNTNTIQSQTSGAPGGVGIYQLVVGGGTQFSQPFQATPSKVGTSLFANGGITFTPYGGIQGDFATGWLLGPEWDTILSSTLSHAQTGIGVCVAPAYLVGGFPNGLTGIQAANGNLNLEAGNSGASLHTSDILDSSSNPGSGPAGVGGPTCWVNPIGNPPTVTNLYQLGGGQFISTPNIPITYATPSNGNAAIIGNARGTPIFSGEPDVYWWDTGYATSALVQLASEAALYSGERTGILSPDPNGPLNGNNTFTICTTSQTTYCPTAGIQMAQSGGCPASNSDQTWGGWPAVYVVGHSPCSSGAWDPRTVTTGVSGCGTNVCGFEYLTFDPGCTAQNSVTGGTNSNCNPAYPVYNTPNPIAGVPVAYDGNTVWLGYQNIPDSQSVFYATLAWATGQSGFKSYLPSASFTGSLAASSSYAGSNGVLTISGSVTGTLTVGQTIYDGGGTGATSCIVYNTNSVGCGTFITGKISGTQYATWTPGGGVTIGSESMATLIPVFSASQFTTAVASNTFPFALYPSYTNNKIEDIVGTSSDTPEEIMVEPSNVATGSTANTTTNTIEIDEERGDLCTQSCLSSEYDEISTVLAAASPAWKFNWRCDELGTANGNAAESGCGATSIPHINAEAQFNRFLILETPGNQYNNLVTSFESQAAISNGDATGNPANAPAPGSFYSKIGIRAPLTTLQPSEFGTMHSGILVHFGVVEVENHQQGAALGGPATSNGLCVRNPQRWAEWGGFFNYACQ